MSKRCSETKLCNKSMGSDSWIACELCDGWFHSRCVNINEESFKLLKDLDTCHWYCTHCNEKIDWTCSVVEARMEPSLLLQMAVGLHRSGICKSKENPKNSNSVQILTQLGYFEHWLVRPKKTSTDISNPWPKFNDSIITCIVQYLEILLLQY